MDGSSSSERRQAVIAAALGWVGTPFHHAQAVKGRGVDCAMSLIEWFSEAALIERFDPRPYPAAWFLHRDEERFLKIVSRYAVHLPPEEKPLPADVALYRYGRCVAHGALVLDEIFVVHACAMAGRVERRERSALRYAFHSHWRVKSLIDG